MSPAGSVESLNHRIRNAAARDGIDSLRLRNRIAFQRMLARLSMQPGWVLKGGFALEVRLGLLARATKDLDVLRVAETRPDALELQDVLDEALGRSIGDGFDFVVRLPKPVRREEAEPSTWRTVIDVRFDGETFGSSTLDVVTMAPERDPAIELITVTPTLVGGSFQVPAIDIHRHAAEKLHAYARIYAHEQPSSRVKDLVDLVLIDDSGLVEPGRLSVSLAVVFRERMTELPVSLPPPPADWAVSYAALASEVGQATRDLHSAWKQADRLYLQAIGWKATSSGEA